MTSPTAIPPLRLKALLQRQELHDSRYHRDVWRLASGARLQHLVLHLAKYVGRMAEPRAADLRSSDWVERTVADAFIIFLSASNAISASFRDISDTITCEEPINSVPDFALQLAIPVGRLAKVCEALDHLETIDSIGIAKVALGDVLAMLQHFAASRHLDLEALAQQRWHELEASRD